MPAKIIDKATAAFQRWIKRHGSRPWENEMQAAFNAGYRAAIKDEEKERNAGNRS